MSFRLLPKRKYDDVKAGNFINPGKVQLAKNNRKDKPQSSPYLINQDLMDKALEASNLKQQYSPNLTIVEMAPAAGVMSTSLYNYFKPKKHILLESRDTFFDPLRKLSNQTGGRMQLIEKEGFKWSTYSELIQSQILQATRQSEEEQAASPHQELLFAAHVPIHYYGLLFTSQIVEYLASRDWLGYYGRVRVLLWLPRSPAITILTSQGFRNRSMTAVRREAFIDTRVLVGNQSIHDGLMKRCPSKPKYSQYLPKPIIQPPDELKFMEPLHDGHILVELTPKPFDNSLSLSLFTQVIKGLLYISRGKLKDSLELLGAGATNLIPAIRDAGVDVELPNFCLSAEDFKTITRIYERWPLRDPLKEDECV
ncbi:mitochondrial RNA polymerase specificity factor, predicted rRNA methyltransferase Mtf1 [Schizosaccharomyces osmophilus]|uniref:rRNA adenine N(6)-methyltransferase n=1 Tax=Schizosaccharomyces osmophilus TaxID=2545709 RepID=A0AAF0ATT4_9SCHI|nr:mitochondrial RNA polymerase specificity factor, predicted rRNA methyltransferase Mtf1 [Schizosaccharomyces osmophilus]WBW71821.1 mitochondrial RNA polymerase specificity factor, predicted rRNA methyltransferase Mtf1 [Schizosaccharomyces osmophilus]